MELLQLRYFYDSARNGSFAKTAEKYMVPASSVSASIRRLENELGTKLFYRSANRVTLNEQGEKLRKSLERVFEELDMAVTDIQCPVGPEKIRLLVRSNRSEITDYIIEYQKKHPNIAFEFSINFDDPDYKSYDIIIGTPDDRYTDYERFVFCNRRVFLRAVSEHPLCGRELTLKQLKEQPFVTMGGNLEKILIAACEGAGFTPNIIANVNDVNCYMKILRSGIAIGHAREVEGGLGKDFSYLNVTDFDQRQRTYVYYKKERVVGNIKNFIEFLKTKCD